MNTNTWSPSCIPSNSFDLLFSLLFDFLRTFTPPAWAVYYIEGSSTREWSSSERIHMVPIVRKPISFVYSTFVWTCHTSFGILLTAADYIVLSGKMTKTICLKSKSWWTLEFSVSLAVFQRTEGTANEKADKLSCTAVKVS